MGSDTSFSVRTGCPDVDELGLLAPDADEFGLLALFLARGRLVVAFPSDIRAVSEVEAEVSGTSMSRT
jgi:hypothetical protein